MLPLERSPQSWTDEDVAEVLNQMLRAIDRARHPDAPADRPIALRGFSWIVNPFEGGVVIALEMTLGAIIGGPFDIHEGQLSAMLPRVLNAERAQAGTPTATVH
jgi:hypothetical protein